ncbi:hypothetical protein RFI_15204 [Reticulomyxa filosa]|uniref:Uncharacterized protein n=1 Tax=Reticulomyxa filosa TaxID=46433 RepID=X6N9M5_RETFI|nr:hypothetical protein RFI_15204 [Reticulomyxa filosa]|eukprot:ETO22002.1 hypothetical protein RFI_15204 [Reticulomyxa filosa]
MSGDSSTDDGSDDEHLPLTRNAQRRRPLKSILQYDELPVLRKIAHPLLYPLVYILDTDGLRERPWLQLPLLKYLISITNLFIGIAFVQVVIGWVEYMNKSGKSDEEAEEDERIKKNCIHAYEMNFNISLFSQKKNKKKKIEYLLFLHFIRDKTTKHHYGYFLMTCAHIIGYGVVYCFAFIQYAYFSDNVLQSFECFLLLLFVAILSIGICLMLDQFYFDKAYTLSDVFLHSSRQMTLLYRNVHTFGATTDYQFLALDGNHKKSIYLKKPSKNKDRDKEKRERERETKAKDKISPLVSDPNRWNENKGLENQQQQDPNKTTNTNATTTTKIINLKKRRNKGKKKNKRKRRNRPNRLLADSSFETVAYGGDYASHSDEDSEDDDNNNDDDDDDDNDDDGDFGNDNGNDNDGDDDSAGDREEILKLKLSTIDQNANLALKHGNEHGDLTASKVPEEHGTLVPTSTSDDNSRIPNLRESFFMINENMWHMSIGFLLTETVVFIFVGLYVRLLGDWSGDASSVLSNTWNIVVFGLVLAALTAVTEAAMEIYCKGMCFRKYLESQSRYVTLDSQYREDRDTMFEEPILVFLLLWSNGVSTLWNHTLASTIGWSLLTPNQTTNVLSQFGTAFSATLIFMVVGFILHDYKRRYVTPFFSFFFTSIYIYIIKKECEDEINELKNTPELNIEFEAQVGRLIRRMMLYDQLHDTFDLAFAVAVSFAWEIFAVIYFIYILSPSSFLIVF